MMKNSLPWVLLKMAFRNIWLHKLRTTVIGMIVVFGSLLAIVGNSLVDAVANGISNSVIHSAAGHIQIYSETAKENLAIFGDTSGSMPEIGHLNSFRQVKDALLKDVPNIKTLVPMGTNVSFVNPGNLLDTKLEELRQSYQTKPTQVAVPFDRDAAKEHLHAIISDIASDVNRTASFFENNQDITIREAKPNLARVMDPGFWQDFDAHAEERIEFLANRIAPLIFDDTQLYFMYIGTIPGLFKETFPSFEIVKGEAIPEGKRGYLFSDYFYERFVKNRVAFRLDNMKKAIEKDREKISASKTLQDLVVANVDQAAEVYAQITPANARALTPELQGLLKSKATAFPDLVREFLKMEDANFSERYAFFYERIAPHLVLYRVKIGDTFPVSTFAKTGFATSANVRVYGTFRFKSFESSPLAGNFGLMDLMTFRDLYGFLTEDRREENRALEKEMGALEVGKDEIENLFGRPSEAEAAPVARTRQSLSSADDIGRSGVRKSSNLDRVYSIDELENGVFLHAAIILKDPSQLNDTVAQINTVSKTQKLGIQAVRWDEASGTVGQLSFVVRAILYVCVVILLGVATFIIMNSMLMAAVERTKEIGTMRAIGAQKKFVFGLLLYEALILSLIFGVIGAIGAMGLIAYLGSVGIPATGEIATFFFSGPRLYPSLSWMSVLAIVILMAVIAVISTQYPAWKAMRITPLEAMRK